MCEAGPVGDAISRDCAVPGSHKLTTNLFENHVDVLLISILALPR